VLSTFLVLFVIFSFFPFLNTSSEEHIKQRSQSQLINAHTIKKPPILKQWSLPILIQLLKEDFSANPNKQCAINTLFTYTHRPEITKFSMLGLFLNISFKKGVNFSKVGDN
jgi:hypothetical protein